jgi:hypothetical protein
MTTSLREQAILGGVQTESGVNNYTHESIEVTVTDTMANGSLLVAAGTEAAIADAALVTGILDAPEIENYATGDTFLTRVARRNVIANKDVINFSDGDYSTETLTILAAAGVILQSADTELEYV